ncbi:hypothetical protein D8674_034945 [Pyrus ussuriensis x Pyrus communis]|uniref:LysM domain-containing protein n=1 Tax=Pyrus ussuriensis x Pyrus communis TaxID=2448454 RepID=A0A5N5GB09_9ROSA|nr:hypothetical protein D8674_034945 [Pyrus ussuriensis x Pyrus communis]
MSDPSSTADDGNSNDDSVVKTAGLVVFSSIAMSILKSTQPIQLPSQPPLPPQQQPITVKEPQPPLRVSIDATKEANGLTGDTIYAGKKLIIP